MARFLVLGAGFVAEPLVEYLNRREDNHMTIAAYTLLESQTLADKFDHVKAIQVDVADRQALMDVIADFDVVVSLVPAPFHLLIAQVCIHHKVNMVTASYQTQEMSALAKQAEDAGICIMNEIGLDPGIDHLSAMQIIDDAQAKGDEIESFVSWCGGIPAPDDNDNPLGYKFSWEPRGAIMVLLNEAIYQYNNQAIKVIGTDLMQWSKPITIADLDLECYPNRNSVDYKEIYGIDSVKDILRGTLRYRGFCGIFQDIKKLGLMQTELDEITAQITWKDYVLGLNKSKNLEDLKA
ncbi:MAG: saccharopine dehydrogenase NADP-binding domain-containing protein, partial [Alcanivoracaceae bacterium]|nr:saccharopine dehydrogenase NADP-binding domain-containing protein [Alcanivoracaceae bacterium]